MRIHFLSWFFGALLWLPIAPAHAQQTPMVQCRIGSFVQPTTGVVCDALMKGAAELRGRGPAPDGMRQADCAKTMLRSLGYANASDSNIHFGAALSECAAILQAMENDYTWGVLPPKPPVCDCPDCRPTLDCVGGKPRR